MLKSAKADMTEISVWKVDDGEYHWIAAKDIDELKSFYASLYEEPLEDAVIEQVDADTLSDPFVCTDEVPRRLISLNDILRDTDTFPALLASSVW